MCLRLRFPPEKLNLFISANLDGKLKEFQKYSDLVKKVALILQFFLYSGAIVSAQSMQKLGLNFYRPKKAPGF